MSTVWCPGGPSRYHLHLLGDQLDDVVSQIVSNADSIKLLTSSGLDTGVSTVPVIKKDATDRNRTSPFAFTGNKFEFRMVAPPTPSPTPTPP